MKWLVQSLFGNASYLPHPYSAISNKPFPSYDMPVTLMLSSIYALFSATASPQPAWNQQLPHSFYRDGGCIPKGSTFSHHSPKKDKR